MCIATVYNNKDNKMVFVTQDIVSLEVKGKAILLTSLLGNQLSLEAKINKIDFLKHTVIIESTK